MKLALSLSGGGFRALGFHLGILARLAKENQLENVTFISTVSGGSLCVGLVYALNNFSWPSSQDYLNRVLPEARRFMTTTALQMGLIRRFLRAPWRLFEPRANDLAYLLKHEWKMDFPLNQLPENPRWMINATCYETGKNWRFERFRMGDYCFGYSNDTKIGLSDVVAASAGYPILIGPLEFDTSPYKWFEYSDHPNEMEITQNQKQHKTQAKTPDFQRIHLFDGGLYDNNGLEGIYDPIKGWRENVEFLVIGDASGKSRAEAYRGGISVYWRLVTSILMGQVRSLRSRAILERMLNHKDPGIYLQIGSSITYVRTQSESADLKAEFDSTCLTAEQADSAAMMATTIHRLAEDEFDLLVRHGFEVADYTLVAYHPSDFKYIGYQNFG